MINLESTGPISMRIISSEIKRLLQKPLDSFSVRSPRALFRSRKPILAAEAASKSFRWFVVACAQKDRMDHRYSFVAYNSLPQWLWYLLLCADGTGEFYAVCARVYFTLISVIAVVFVITRRSYKIQGGP